MAANKYAHNLRQRYHAFRAVDQQRNGVIEELLERLESLEEEYEIAILDKARESDYGREAQRRERDLQAELRRYKSITEQDPFILVLIDGDGMIFDDSLLQKGEQGGRDAAGYLWSAIREYIALNLPDVPSPKIVARVYANVKGLADACYKGGIVERLSVFEEFTRGFTGSKQLFDFVDVGMGKDRADDKLSEIFKLHLNDCHCRQVVLGCSHDNGYARLLEEFLGDVEMTDKITLLEGVPFERELAHFVERKAFKSAKFEGLFRGEKIVAKQTMLLPQLQPQSHQFAQFPQRPSMPMIAGPTPVPQIFSPPITPASTNNSCLARTTSNASSSPSISAATPSVPTSWAYAAKQAPAFVPATNNQGLANATTNNRAPAGATTTNKSPAPTQTQIHKGPATPSTPQIRRNRYGQRVDSPLPVPPKDEMNRIKKLKLCNQYMLRGECNASSGTCYHDHDTRLSAGEMTTLRYIARMAPCKMGSECEDPKCTHGHVCPQSEEGKKDCYWKENCWFSRELHGLDTTPAKTLKIG